MTEKWQIVIFCAITVLPLLLCGRVHEPEEYDINTPGCRIAKQYPDSEVTARFSRKFKNKKCSRKFAPLVSANATYLWVNEDEVAKINATSSLYCCYKYHSTEPNTTFADGVRNMVETTESCFFFRRPIYMVEEFISVQCKNGTDIVFRDMFALVPQHKMISRLSEYELLERVSVLIIGIESVSRTQLERQLPKTRAYLKRSGAYELKGHLKNGLYLYENIIGMLTGESADEIENTCLKNGSKLLDSCPMMWNEFTARSFTTFLGEDTRFNTSFLNDKRGFSLQPTDYYLQPFMLIGKDPDNPLKDADLNCFQSRSIEEAYFEYIQYLIEVTSEDKVPYWAMFWGGNHAPDLYNMRPKMDTLYLNLFRRIVEGTSLVRTLVVFMSDQGQYKTAINRVKQGFYEERQPFAYILVPNFFKSEYKDAIANLEQNQYTLTTHYDIGATIRNILDIEQIGQPFSYKKGTSLFSKIPHNRTCKDAGIRLFYCPCMYGD